ncbi:MAG TPA: hypothetical protein VEL73_07510 [Mycobacteriales bacterium]|nr:hypothetical protein [Mycobacteriales bacterium]
MLTEQMLSVAYDAPVRVLTQPDGTLAVLPIRAAGRARPPGGGAGHTWG